MTISRSTPQTFHFRARCSTMPGLSRIASPNTIKQPFPIVNEAWIKVCLHVYVVSGVILFCSFSFSGKDKYLRYLHGLRPYRVG